MEKYTEISLRQAKILAAIVKENCESGQPVASRDLVEKYNFEVSPATIRSEMAVLEDQGFITQPHTSSGRVPTDVGFRYFVNELMDRVKLSIKERDRLREEVVKLHMANAEIGRRLAKLLTDHSDQASFALFPEEISTMGLSKVLDNAALPPEDARAVRGARRPRRGHDGHGPLQRALEAQGVASAQSLHREDAGVQPQGFLRADRQGP